MFAETDNDQAASLDGVLTYQRTSTETATEGVLEAVSMALDRPVLPEGAVDPLPPLYDVIDPEALDAIFDEPLGNPTLTFEYSGCTVTIESDEIAVEQF